MKGVKMVLEEQILMTIILIIIGIVVAYGAGRLAGYCLYEG